jgi:hypothetical protein
VLVELRNSCSQKVRRRRGQATFLSHPSLIDHVTVHGVSIVMFNVGFNLTEPTPVLISLDTHQHPSAQTKTGPRVKT